MVLAALDIIESKIYKTVPAKYKRKPPSNRNKTLFDNKAISLLIYQA